MPKLDFSQRDSILKHLQDETRADNGYFLLLVLSVVITVLGLVLNSAAIIIGGMVVSPLLYPVMAMGAATVSGDARLLKRALFLTLRSSLVAVGVAFLVTLASPLREQTHEIISRTEPTIIDLVIALASGMAGAYAVAIKQRFASLIGVVISAALMPPLVIVGFAIATSSYEILLGTFLLYLANLIAIVVSTVAVFYVLGFRPGRSQEKQFEARRDLAVSLAIFVLVFTVLSFFLLSTISQAQRTRTIEIEIHTFLKSYNDTILVNLDERAYPSQTVIKATIQGPAQFTQAAVDILDQKLEERLGEVVNLQILHIPVTKLVGE